MRVQSLSLGIAGVVAAFFLSSTVHAMSGGQTNHSGKGAQTCTSACHGRSPSAAIPTVTLTGPDTLAAGATGNYTLTISGGAAVKGGMNVAVSNNGGTLGIVAGDLKLAGGELTHTAAKVFTGTEVQFEFTLKAPSAAGTTTLFASGNSTNGNGNEDGDRSVSITKQVQITGGTGNPDAGTGNPDAGTGEPGDGEEDDGGCSAAGGAPLIALLALLAAAGLRRRSV
ncbi:MXAN_6652 family MXYO-CTERM-anchored protein [Hyalangium sp.]|uniref:MXAN_6652 family MXYO-CTERM-anchored protein n=1 Tax=Hyalangium sp. TaxID=2028555 RepID=UPI002D6A1107|nr:MXAN_6652 family MXYO-CTERM-anchored protein [Hyalangium sp.]HYH99514.1 MXAN_6652 family MXYO-CTERM-anchored protein [Hyalangium sp.]